MKTVKEVSEITGVSIRTLRYYDEIELLKPTALTDANYRLYDDAALTKLQQILFFRELEIPLEDIKVILENPRYNKEETLLAQKNLLEYKRNKLNGLIELIDDVIHGVNTINFDPFGSEDVRKILDHILELQNVDSLKTIIEKYGSIEQFRASVGKQLVDNSSHYIKLFGGKDKAIETSLLPPLDAETCKMVREENNAIYYDFAKAKQNADDDLALKCVARLAENCKRMFRLENARYLLLKVANDYLNEQKNPEVISLTEEKFGVGITNYIGLAIKRYYGV